MRHELIASLTRQLSAVTSRRVSLALGLWGEPGIGKTHTVHAIAQHLPCAHLSLHATASTAQIAASLPRAKTLPAWAVAQLGRMGRGETIEDRAVVQTLATALSGLAPFVLHLEDLHEATTERAALVESLARAVLRSRGVGLLVTSRAELPEPFRNHHLEALSEVETTALLRQELKAEPPTDGLEWVFGRTRGNPLFTLEFVRYLRRQGFFWSDGERWHWRAPTGNFVPITVEAVIAQFIANLTLTPEARVALSARSVLPTELNPQRLDLTWAAVAGLNQKQFGRVVGELERCGVLNGQRIAHPLVAETIARELSSAERAQFARRALDALEPLDPAFAAEYVSQAGLHASEATNRLEGLADRLRESGDLRRAAHVLGRAAHQANGQRQAALAVKAARSLLERDLPEAERLARIAMRDPTQRKEATFVCVSALQSNARHDEAWQLLVALPKADQSGLEWWEKRVQFHAAASQHRDAMRVWDEQPDFQAVATVWTRHKTITCLLYLSETARAAALIAETLARSDLTPRERARILDRRNFMFFRDAQYEIVEQTLTEILGLLDHDVFASDCATYFANRSIARSRLNKHLEARQDAEQACRLDLSTGVLTSNIGFPTTLALSQIYLEEYQQAEEVLLEATALAQLHGHSRLWDCYGHLSFLYLRWNPPHGPMLARRYARLSLEATRRIEHDDALVKALEDCVRAELGCAAPAAALEYARELECVAQRTGLEEDATATAALLGRSLAALGQREAALPHLRRASELYEAHGNHNESLSHALEIDRLENDVESARQKLAWFEAQGDTRHAARTIAYFPQLRSAPLVVASTSSARLNVLGTVTLERDGQPVPTRAKKRLELLAYLLETRIAGRSEASALELVDAFYAGTAEPEAKNTLKQQVYLIRSGFGAESIVSTATGYALGAVSSDAEDFLRGGDSSLWRGAYLGGLSDGFHASVREALTLALHGKIEELLEVNPREAARLGVILLEMEPYDAEILRLTVQALERSGAAGAARRTFSEGRARLTEIGEAVPELASEFLSVRATA